MPDRTIDTWAALKDSTFIPAPPVEKSTAAARACSRAAFRSVFAIGF
jgi:hypothetical protein